MFWRWFWALTCGMWEEKAAWSISTTLDSHVFLYILKVLSFKFDVTQPNGAGLGLHQPVPNLHSLPSVIRLHLLVGKSGDHCSYSENTFFPETIGSSPERLIW